MLPKPEKKSSRFSSEQLDLVNTISDADKLKTKRRTLIIFLILTIGLSLCFYFYRQFKTLNFSQIKFPQISTKLLTLPQLKLNLDIPENWIFEILPYEASSSFQKNNPTPYAKKYLPDGVNVSEKILDNHDSLEISSQISTPQNKFQIYAKIPGSISSTSLEVDQFAKLVETYYWHLFK